MSQEITEQGQSKRPAVNLSGGIESLYNQHLAFLVDNTTDFIGMCDLEFRPFFVNKAGSAAVSLAAKPDANVFDFFFPDDHHFLRTEFFPKVMRDGQAVTEIRFKDFRTGEPVWMEYSVVRMDDADGRPTGYATISRNLFERKRSEARLDSKRRILEMIATGAPLSTTLDAIVGLLEMHWPDGVASIMLVDEAGRLHVGAAPRLPASYSAALEGLEIGPAVGSCGTAAYRREPVIVSDILTDPLWADYRQLASASGLRACWSIPIVSSTDRVLGTIAVYYREPREPAFAATTFASDSAASLAAIAIERNLIDRELRDQARALAASDRNKDEFIAKLAHELRNPLAAIQAAIEILKVRTADDSPLQRPHAVIERQTKHIVQLIDDLRDLSQIALGKIALRRQRVDVCSVASDASDTVRPLALSRQQQLDVTLPEAPVYVDGDPGRLMQVFINLLNNAVKYTQFGGQIGLTVEWLDRMVVIRVRDNGLGIRQSMLPKVFDLDVQSDRALEHAQGGVGIGLHVVQSLVRLHGGSVTATSAGVGLGSEFEVRLPTYATAPQSPVALTAG